MTEKSKGVTSNKERGSKRRRIAIHGKPGSGKTCAAGGLVEGMGGLMRRFSETRAQLDKEKWVKLNALWVSADTNATEGFRVRKIEVPEVDLMDLFADDQDGTQALEILEQATDIVYDHVKKEKPQVVVIDTASAIDKPLMRTLENTAPRTKSGARDSFAIWRMGIAVHDRFHTNMNGLGCDVVFLMHSKPRSESELSEKKARAQAVAGQLADIRFDFMYEDVANIYRRHCDLILIADKAKGSTEAEYALYTEEWGGFESKSRYGNLVPGKITEPLWDVFEKYVEGK